MSKISMPKISKTFSPPPLTIDLVNARAVSAQSTAEEAQITAEEAHSLGETAAVDIRDLMTKVRDLTICSNLGMQQGDLRIYTSEECDAMGGIYSQNGECTKKNGGSFSYDCGRLYNDTFLYNPFPWEVSRRGATPSKIGPSKIGGRRKRTTRGKGGRRGTRRYRK